jgi:UDP-glucose 4-epimerase
LVVGDLADPQAVQAVLANGPWAGVLHFAALSLVGESMQVPFRYLRENLVNALNLIEACVENGVRRFILSSTSNLFGQTDIIPINENARIDPGSPYGESKLMIERALFWADRVHGLRSACLRYFNAAGADPAGRLGEDHDPETHLIPLAIDAALGRRPALQMFGDDYDTPDGTCIRDYVHVTDLADAHVRALDLLERQSVTFNIGTGSGHSVRAILDAVGRVAGCKVPMEIAPRRAGDPAILVAGSEKLRRETGWLPQFTELDRIIETAFAWRQLHPHGYNDKKGT